MTLRPIPVELWKKTCHFLDIGNFEKSVKNTFYSFKSEKIKENSSYFSKEMKNDAVSNLDTSPQKKLLSRPQIGKLENNIRNKTENGSVPPSPPPRLRKREVKNNIYKILRLSLKMTLKRKKVQPTGAKKYPPPYNKDSTRKSENLSESFPPQEKNNPRRESPPCSLTVLSFIYTPPGKV